MAERIKQKKEYQMATKELRVQVPREEIIERIRTKLAGSPLELLSERWTPAAGPRWQHDLLHIVDTERQLVVEEVVDLEDTARRLGVLGPCEEEAAE